MAALSRGHKKITFSKKMNRPGTDWGLYLPNSKGGPLVRVWWLTQEFRLIGITTLPTPTDMACYQGKNGRSFKPLLKCLLIRKQSPLQNSNLVTVQCISSPWPALFFIITLVNIWHIYCFFSLSLHQKVNFSREETAFFSVTFRNPGTMPGT